MNSGRIVVVVEGVLCTPSCSGQSESVVHERFRKRKERIMNTQQTSQKTPALSFRPVRRSCSGGGFTAPGGQPAVERSRGPTPKPFGGKWRESAILLVSRAGDG
jgi:hypothetical protein